MGLEFRILGTIEVLRSGVPVELGGPRQKALLTLLVIEANRVVSADRLAEELWARLPPERALPSVQGAVYRLRRALGPDGVTVHTQPPGYVLAVDPAVIDSRQFHVLAEAGRAALGRGEWSAAAESLCTAVGLWRGPALGELGSEPFARAEAARLEEARLAAVEDHVEARLALGQHQVLVADLEALVHDHPLRERLWGQLIVALYRCGRQAEALRAYQQCRRALAEELGIDPGPALRALEAAVLAHDPALELVPAAAPAPEPALSTPLTSFVGRQAERAELEKLAETERLVTLTGTGGVGKTRLALAVAAQLADRFPDGVALAELAPLSESSLVPHAVAAAVGVREEPGRSLVATLCDRLRPRRLLVVLDNCEHLVAAAAELAQAVLAVCPGLSVLATSREPLGVPGEICWRVPSLAIPDPVNETALEALLHFDAARLFLERAQAARPDLAITDADARTIAQICARLDGIPLALELAAARVSALSLTQIATRLDDRFELLARGPRTVAPRHQTLRAALDWSYELLNAPERVLFRRLSVFTGGFTLEAVEAVCSGGGVSEKETLDLLASLVDKSLAVMDQERGDARYRLLETVREYAAERLAEAGDEARTRTRHLQVHLEMAEAMESDAYGDDGGPVLDRLEVDHDNFRAALQWSFEAGDETELGLRLAHALYPLWELRDHRREGRTWMEQLLAFALPATPIASAVARRAGNLAWAEGAREEAGNLWEKALTLADQCRSGQHRGRALTSLSRIAIARGELPRAHTMLEEAETIALDVGDHGFVAESRLWLGWVAQREGRYDDARTRARQCFGEGVGGSLHRGNALHLLGWVEREQGNLGEARRHLEGCLALAAEVGDEDMAALGLEGLGAVAAAEGRAGDARCAYEDALARSRALHQLYPAAAVLGGLAALACGAGDFATAMELVREGAALSRQLSDVYLIACSLNQVGAVVAGSGDATSARTTYREALGLSFGCGMPFPTAAALEGLAAVELEANRPRVAAVLLGAADGVRETIGVSLPPATRPLAERSREMARAKLGDLFAEDWRKGRGMSLIMVHRTRDRLTPDRGGPTWRS